MERAKFDWRRPGWKTVAAAGAVVAAIGAVALPVALARQAPTLPAYLQSFPDFNPAITAQMPGDVDPGLKAKLEQAQKFPQVQREFDLYSWQMFLALNWPTNDTGQAAKTFTDTSFGSPHWTLWQSSPEIFQTDGATPSACSQGATRKLATTRTALAKPISKGLPAFSAAAVKTDHRKTRFLGVISAVGELNASTQLSEIGQAFTGPLIDQNGEFVFYEILIDPNEVNYICANSLYNINGQVAFSQNGTQSVSMPWGDASQDWSGVFELKLAWRIMTKKDDLSRYYTMPAVVMDQTPKGPKERPVTVGLVGMHIAHKTTSSPQWIWSTFEHVDNLDVDDVANPNLKPSFYDPNCQICTVNQLPQQDSNGIYPRTPVQAWRAVPIPSDKQALNAQVRTALAGLGSVFQYYQLVDTQWPTSPTTPPTPYTTGLPGSVANKPGGQPTPTYLTNITMETYFQGGAEEACNAQEGVPNSVNCLNPPSTPNPAASPQIWTSPMNNSGTAGLPGLHTQIFGTESCMGCHSSAGIYSSYTPATPTAPASSTKSGQLTGDFSWLFSQKAAWYAGTTPKAATPAKPKKKG